MSFEKILLIGLGNPILGDDGVGWAIVREVESRIGAAAASVEVDYLSLGGLSLMERLIGYKKVVLIDSLTTGARPEGEVAVFALSDLADIASGHMTAAHDTSLKTALAVGRKLGAALPEDKDIRVVAVEAKQVYDIQEGLTPAVAAAVPVAVQQVLDILKTLQTDLS